MSFTVKGYNDVAKSCKKKNCDGKVRPTWNANVGKCDKCGKKYGWNEFVWTQRNKVVKPHKRRVV